MTAEKETKKTVELDTVVKEKSGTKTIDVNVEVVDESNKFGEKYRLVIKFPNGTTASDEKFLSKDEINYIKSIKKSKFKGSIYEGTTNDIKWVYCETDLENGIKKNFFLKGIGKKLYRNMRGTK